MITPTPDVVLDEVVEYYGVYRNLLLASCKRGSIAHARHVFCYLARKHTLRNLEEIGRFLGRDHSTIINSLRVIEAKLAASDGVELERQIHEIERRLGVAPLAVTWRAGDVLTVVGGRGEGTLLMSGCGDYPWER